jgi:hypothetical protein
MKDEIERRKENIRRVWDYRWVDHIPILLQVESNPWGYTTQEHFQDGEKQFQFELEKVKLSLDMIPDDYIPSMRPDVGCVVIESALGAEIVFGDNPDQTCYPKEPLIKDIDDVYLLQKPDPHKDGLVPEGLKRIRDFVERTDGEVYVACLDMNGIINTAFTLLGSELCLTAMYDAGEALEYLCGFLTEVFIDIVDECIASAGGIDRVTSSDFPYMWHPEGRKGHVSDDISANYSRDFFNRFSRPFNNLIFQRYGGGMLHNCGPNPCVEEYLWHDPRIYAVDLAWDYSKNDLEAFKKAFKGEGIIYFYFESGTWEEKLQDYKRAMEALVPDVIAIPWVVCEPKDEPETVYNRFLEVAREYAARMNWRSDK